MDKKITLTELILKMYGHYRGLYSFSNLIYQAITHSSNSRRDDIIQPSPECPPKEKGNKQSTLSIILREGRFQKNQK